LENHLENPGNKEKMKKQVPLRLSPGLWEELNRWAADEFRSLNGQIEYLLTQCVKERRRPSREDAGEP
jgi:hypothetical protein